MRVWKIFNFIRAFRSKDDNSSSNLQQKLFTLGSEETTNIELFQFSSFISLTDHSICGSSRTDFFNQSQKWFLEHFYTAQTLSREINAYSILDKRKLTWPGVLGHCNHRPLGIASILFTDRVLSSIISFHWIKKIILSFNPFKFKIRWTWWIRRSRRFFGMHIFRSRRTLANQQLMLSVPFFFTLRFATMTVSYLSFALCLTHKSYQLQLSSEAFDSRIFELWSRLHPFSFPV